MFRITPALFPCHTTVHFGLSNVGLSLFVGVGISQWLMSRASMEQLFCEHICDGSEVG